MKNLKRFAINIFVFGLGSLGLAQTPATPPTAGNNNASHPCEQIVQACKSAGFVKGEAKEGKGLFKDCVGPVMHGQTVSGVTVSGSTIQACQAKRATWKGNHE